MTFRGDDRAVSTVVGAVLIFGILVLALGVYQAQIVPTENEQVEYRHSQTVGNQMQELRNSLVGAARTGSGAPASVELGTRYPMRTFAVNPPPATGTLRSVPLDDVSDVTIRNVEATDGETADFLSGTLTYGTKGLAYEPDYSQLQSAPTSRYEYGTLYDAYESGDINRTAGLLVRGNEITVVTLNASDSFSESGVQATSVDPEALSAPYRATEVENSGGTLTLELPTNATEEMWRGMYEDRASVNDVSVTDGVAEVTFADGTYDLRMAAVGVGSGLEKPDAKYLTVVEESGNSITLEARDRYNNPVGDLKVSIGSGKDVISGPTKETGAEGQVTYRAADGESGDISFEIDDGAESYERVNARLDGRTTGPSTPAEPLYNVQWATDEIESQNGVDFFDGNNTLLIRGAPSGFNIDMTAEVTNESGSGVDGAFLDYASDNGTVASFSSDGTTDTSGQSTVPMRVGPNGSATVHAASVSGVDSLTAKVNHVGFNPVIRWEVTDSTQNNNVNYDVRYEVSGTDDRFNRVAVRFDNQRVTWADAWRNSTNPDSTVSYSQGGTEDDTYEITITAYADDGTVLAERSLTDVADGSNPTSDDSFGTGSESPSGVAQNVEISQIQTNNGQIVPQFRNNNGQSVSFARARLDSYSEANPPSGNSRDPINRIVYWPNQDGPELLSGGSFEDIGGPTISNNGNQGVTLQPQRRTNQGGGSIVDADAQSGDTITFTIEFGDGSTRQYTETL